MPNQSPSPPEVAAALLASVRAHPDATNVMQFIHFTAVEASPEQRRANAEALAAALRADPEQWASPADLNAAVLDPRFRVNGHHRILIATRTGDRLAVDARQGIGPLHPGDQVTLERRDDGLIIGHAVGRYPPSRVQRIERVLDGGAELTVREPGGEQLVLTIAAGLRDHPDLTAGAEIFTAPEVRLAVALSEPREDEASLRLLDNLPTRTLADLGGQPRAKREMERMLALMTTPPADLAAYGLRRSLLTLFTGPAGVGKTLAALIIASSLAAERDVAVVFVRGPEFLNAFVGASEAAVRGLFEKLRLLAQRREMVLVIWDEFEALFRARGKRFSSTLVDDTLVPQLLASIDSLEKDSLDNVWLIAISNRPDLLDSAVVREGRLGAKIVFTNLATEGAAAEVAAIHLAGRLLAEGLTLPVAAERLAAHAFSGGPAGRGAPVAAVRLRDGRTVTVTSRDILTGALIKGAIDRAGQAAWWRSHRGGAAGITVADLQRGLDAAAADLPLSVDNLGEHLGWPLDEVARVVDVRGAR